MANASKDQNGISSLVAMSSANGTTIIRVKVDSSTHKLKVSDGSTGSDLGPRVAGHDENSVSTLLAVSSSDGKTPVAVYTDSSGNLLIKST